MTQNIHRLRVTIGVCRLMVKDKKMKPNLAATSMLLFLISLAMLLSLTLFESSLCGLTTTMERFVSALVLVLPAAIGVVFGILSLRRREPQPWIGVAGILLNGAFAIFNVLVLSFAG
jgi:hypothetical protein